MKSLKKIIVGLMITSLLLVIYNSNNTKAHAATYKYNTVKELLSELKIISKDSSMTATEKATYLYKNTNPAILKDYYDQAIEDIQNKINQIGQSLEETSFDTASGSSSLTKSLDLFDGGKLSVTISDSDDTSSTTSVPQAQFSTGTDQFVKSLAYVTKGYGNRVYTIKYHVKAVLYPDAILALRNHYNISKKNGLTLNYVEDSGTNSIFPTNIDTTDLSIVDKTAKKVGWDINGQGRYTVTFGGYNGIGIAVYRFTVTSYIRLDKLYTKSAKIKENYKATH